MRKKVQLLISLLMFVSFSLNVFSQIIEINSSTVWDVSTGIPDPYTITDGIVVKDGGVLDVSVDLLFDQNSGIKVEKGGMLILRSITATASSSNFLWDGILIEGTNGSPVLPVPNINPIPGAPHGVVLIDNSTIRDAKIGVEVGNISNGNTGGLLQALGTSFINNGIGVKYNEFGPSTSQSNLGNANYLRNCTFTLTQTLNDLYDGGNMTKQFIYIDKFSGGITFRGLDVNTQNFSIFSVAANKTEGIYCTGGTQNILLDESEDETIDGIFYAGRRNTFNTLFKGVHFSSSTSGTNYELLASDFRNSDFTKVGTCFHFERSSSFNVDCNNQTVDFNNNFISAASFEYQMYTESQGLLQPLTIFPRTFNSCFIWVEESFEYNIRNNSVEWQSGFTNRGVGILAYNSVTGNTPTIYISNNNFFFSGTETSAETYGCWFIGDNLETQLTCNTFNSLYRDLALKGLIWGKTNGQGNGNYYDVLSTQGNFNRQPENTFSDNSSSTNLNIESDVDLIYHYYGAANPTNLTYPNWVLFDSVLQAFLTTNQNITNNPQCFATSCIPLVDKTKSELLEVLFPNNYIEKISCFPNPTQKELFINLNKRVKSLKIFDNFGREIKNFIFDDFYKRISFRNLSNGLYMVYIQDNNNTLYYTKFSIN